MLNRKANQKLRQKQRKKQRQNLYLSTRELAKRWKTSESKIEADRHLGRGAPYVKLGGLVRYPLSRIEAYEESVLVDPTNSIAGGEQ